MQKPGAGTKISIPVIGMLQIPQNWFTDIMAPMDNKNNIHFEQVAFAMAILLGEPGGVC